MQGNTKTIDPSSDLCGAVASLSSGDTLILKPGVYKIARHIVVDKDVVIKGSTGAAKDVVIIREGSTAAVIAGGSPTFENLTFVSPGGNADAGQDSISYESCVAVRGGSPTFIGCRATSAEQSGYSVRGEGVAAKLVRCEARGTCHGGIFFDGRATGLLEECLFADNGLGCVDVEDTADGKWVEIRKCRLIKSGFASLSIHNGGRVRIADSELVAYDTNCVKIHDAGSTLEARSVQFRGLLPPEPGHEENLVPMGIAAFEATVRVFDSTFKNFKIAVALYQTPLTLERCSVTDCAKSIFSSDAAENCNLTDCRLCADPVYESGDVGPDDDDEDDDFDDDFDDDEDEEFDEDEDEDEDDEDEEDEDDEFTDEEYQKAMEIKEKKIEEFVGPQADMVMHAIIPYAVGGPFDGYIHPRSKYGGTFFVSEELVDPSFSSPSNSMFHSFELAMATRQKCPAKFFKDGAEDEDDGGQTEEQPKKRPFFMNLFKPKEAKADFDKTLSHCVNVMTQIGRYIESGATVNRYETLEFPKDFDLEDCAGRCFVFDAIGTPFPAEEVPLKELLAVFDRDVYEVPKEDRAMRDPNKPGTFGLLLLIEVDRSEMNLARKIGGDAFIEKLKEKGYWPFSDLDREKIK